MSRNTVTRQILMDRVVRINSWQEFKRLAVSLKPAALVYNMEQNGLSSDRELISLRLIMETKEAYYVFLDFPKEDKLRETGIPIPTGQSDGAASSLQELIDFRR